MRALIRQIEGDSDLDRLHDLSRLIGETVTYEVGASETEWGAEEVLEAGKGVCQDHAHVFIAAARAMGVPARYVSGYLMMDDRVAQEAMHAWAEAHVPGLGWVGFDVSNAISPDIRYVRVATGAGLSQRGSCNWHACRRIDRNSVRRNRSRSTTIRNRAR